MREVSFLERETYLVMSLLLFGCTAHRRQQQQTAPTMKFTVEYSVMWLLVRFNPATTGNKWNRTQHWRYNFIVTTEAYYSCFGKCWTENRVWKSGQHLSKFQFPASECTLFNCWCCCLENSFYFFLAIYPPIVIWRLNLYSVYNYIDKICAFVYMHDW